MNWTIREDRFQLFSFLGGFLQMVTELIVVNSRKSKNFVHKLATQRKTAVNAGDRKLLMDCKLLVGARGFEPPTSRSRTVRSTRLSHAPTWMG